MLKLEMPKEPKKTLELGDYITVHMSSLKPARVYNAEPSDMQVYREEARYLERTAPWVERVGLSYVKQRIVDDAQGRKILYERFLESQKYAQIDPWKERAEGGEAHEFTPIKFVSA